uniref:Uncharacterized protein n=1 Tax=Populus trichocarpa TaxID=3694 RepID=A0A3N7FJJ2_POPTR
MVLLFLFAKLWMSCNHLFFFFFLTKLTCHVNLFVTSKLCAYVVYLLSNH